MVAPDLAGPVLRWQRQYGRHDLPWQNTRDPYRVWLSEIMLQQTQVATVLDYFPRFLQRFDSVQALAAAPLDDVLGLWSGLGYYSRARNLHACAQQVMQQHAGEFPRTAAQLRTLPGIGRSTAAAIASICFSERAAILDGNVKRVLTRVLGFDHDLSRSAHERLLWQHAEALLPQERLHERMPRYTQAMMDLGATVCLPRKPACHACPLGAQCAALREGRPEHYPVKTSRLKRSAQSLWLLWAQTRQGHVWLSRRPTPGVWAGLYCFELFDSWQDLVQAVPTRYRDGLQDEPAFTHVLTHKDLHLHPVRLQVPRGGLGAEGGGWFSPQQWPQLGLPAPVRKLLTQG